MRSSSLIHLRTVRVETLRRSATSAIVKNLIYCRGNDDHEQAGGEPLPYRRRSKAELERSRFPNLLRCGGLALALPLQTRAVSNSARHADPVELRAPAFGPCPVQHGSTDLLSLAELSQWLGMRRAR